MKTTDKWVLLLLGAAIWLLGTLWYEFRGPKVLESGDVRYWLNFALTPVVTAVGCVLILRWRQMPGSSWAGAGLLLAIPGMFGEALLLSRFTFFMPKLQAGSAGRYGALLFATYGVFLTVCEIVSLRAG